MLFQNKDFQQLFLIHESTEPRLQCIRFIFPSTFFSEMYNYLNELSEQNKSCEEKQSFQLYFAVVVLVRNSVILRAVFVFFKHNPSVFQFYTELSKLGANLYNLKQVYFIFLNGARSGGNKYIRKQLLFSRKLKKKFPDKNIMSNMNFEGGH